MKGLAAAGIVLGLLAAWELGWWLAADVEPVSPWTLAAWRADPAVAAQVVDVRTPFEYDLFHIPNARHIPELLVDPAAGADLDPSRPVVLVCMTGHRSSLAGHALREQGFGAVYSLTGGSLGWLLTGHEIDTGRADGEHSSLRRTLLAAGGHLQPRRSSCTSKNASW